MQATWGQHPHTTPTLENNMDYFLIDFPVDRYHHVEISSCFKHLNKVYSFGFKISASKRHFSFMISLGLIDFDLFIKWKGDHAGFGFTVDTPFVQLIDFNFYDIRHEDNM